MALSLAESQGAASRGNEINAKPPATTAANVATASFVVVTVRVAVLVMVVVVCILKLMLIKNKLNMIFNNHLDIC